MLQTPEIGDWTVRSAVPTEIEEMQLFRDL